MIIQILIAIRVKCPTSLRILFYFYVYLGSRDTDGSCLDGFNSNNLELTSKYGSFVPVDMVFAVDQKMDDGLYNSGSIRSLCNERIGYDGDYPDFDDYTATIDYNNGMKSKNTGCDEMTFKLEI